jgi:hypothetical protein
VVVSDYVTDVVMSSLKTCNMNCGSRWDGRGRVGSKGWAVDHQPGTSVDGHSHHDHQKGDFQVSKKGWFIVQEMGSGQRGESKGVELANRAIFTKCCMCMYRCSCVLTSNECCV